MGILILSLVLLTLSCLIHVSYFTSSILSCLAHLVVSLVKFFRKDMLNSLVEVLAYLFVVFLDNSRLLNLIRRSFTVVYLTTNNRFSDRVFTLVIIEFCVLVCLSESFVYMASLHMGSRPRGVNAASHCVSNPHRCTVMCSGTYFTVNVGHHCTTNWLCYRPSRDSRAP